MHLDLDEMAYALMFVVFTLFLISIVEGIVLKIAIGG